VDQVEVAARTQLNLECLWTMSWCQRTLCGITLPSRAFGTGPSP